MSDTGNKQPVAVVAESLMRTCYDEANRLANHGSNGLERMVMSHLYDAANEAKGRLAAAADESAKASIAEETRSPQRMVGRRELEPSVDRTATGPLAVVPMGYRKLITYTLPEEGGVSLKAAGWRMVGEAGGGKWSRGSRPRVDDAPTQIKWRWEAGDGNGESNNGAQTPNDQTEAPRS